MKKKKTLAVGMVLLIFALVFALVAGIGAVAIMKMNSPIEKLKRALNEKEFGEVQTLYEDNRSDEDFKSQADDILLDFINSSYENYQNEEISFDDALDSLKAMKFYGDEPTTLISKMRKISSSRAAYSNAEKSIQAGDYEKALQLYKRVIEDDANNYELAKQKMNDCIAAIRVQSKEVISELIKAGNYREVFPLIDSLQNDIVDDEIHILKEQAITELAGQVDSYIEEKKYSEALAVLVDDSGDVIDEAFADIVKDCYIGELQSLKARVNVKYDSIGETHTIESKLLATLLFDGNLIPSIGIGRRFAAFMLFAGFENRNWIFTDKIIISCGEDKFVFPIDYSDLTTQVGYGKIYELTVLDYVKEDGVFSGAIDPKSLMQALSKAEKVVVRFSGQGNKDVTISSTHLNEILNIWRIYEILEKAPDLVSYLTRKDNI